MTTVRRRRGRRRTGASPVTVGVVALVLLSALLYLGFTKDLPFTRGFQIKAQFESSNSIRENSPVRIAGVNVGRIVEVSADPDGQSALVTMEIDDEGRPIHEDATAKIRPRIFLEGNFFVDLSPGTPGAPELADGDTIKVTQTATPVQLDEVLTALQDDTRTDLQDVLKELGTALSAEQADGRSAAEALNAAYDEYPAAFRSTALVAEALLGTEPERDLARLVRQTGRVTGALNRSEAALGGFVSNFNTTMAAFAAEEDGLRRSIRELGPTLEAANPTLTALNEAFPATRAFAREILPGVRETPATIRASFPWIEQARALVSDAELGGLLDDLSPATADLARVTDGMLDFLPQQDLAARCASQVILPAGDIVIRDEFESGQPNYRDFFYGLVGLAAESQNFDGNGPMVRFSTGGGAQTTQLGDLYGRTSVPPLGTRPAYRERRPAYRRTARCHTQAVPDLNGPAAARGPGDRVVAGGTATQARAVAAHKRERLEELRRILRPFGSRRGTGDGG